MVLKIESGIIHKTPKTTGYHWESVSSATEGDSEEAFEEVVKAPAAAQMSAERRQSTWAAKYRRGQCVKGLNTEKRMTERLFKPKLRSIIPKYCESEKAASWWIFLA